MAEIFWPKNESGWHTVLKGLELLIFRQKYQSFCGDCNWRGPIVSGKNAAEIAFNKGVEIHGKAYHTTDPQARPIVYSRGKIVVKLV